VRFCRTAEPMTAEGSRKGEPSTKIMRNGPHTQPAPLVRGSSRRIMSLRFRPAYISVINRRASAEAVIGSAVQANPLQAHQQDVIPPKPPIEALRECQNGARRQGFASPRPTPARPCLLRAVPARSRCDGRLRRDQGTPYQSKKTLGLSRHLTRSLHISFRREPFPRDPRQEHRADPCVISA